MELTDDEIRVLGCLIEKQATTPDQYPLSTNALVTACNQKSNREPVMDLDERTVVDAMLGIRQHGLARTNASGRADKHRHILPDALDLGLDELAVLAIMLLRGPQSVGELKTRTERYPTTGGTGFETLDQVEGALRSLADRTDPLVVDIGRGSGQSQHRWAHLLGESVPPPGEGPAAAPPIDRGPTLSDRVAALEARLARLEAELGLDGEPASDDRVEPGIADQGVVRPGSVGGMRSEVE